MPSWTANTAQEAAQQLLVTIVDAQRHEPPPRSPAVTDAHKLRAYAGGAGAALLVLLGFYQLLTPPIQPDAAAFHLIAGASFLLLALMPTLWAVQQLRGDPTGPELDELERAHGLVRLGDVRLPRGEAGRLPWFATEEHVTDTQYATTLLLTGQLYGHELAYVVCQHVINPMATNDLLRKTGLAKVGAKRNLRLRYMDAVVRLAPLAAPELLIVPWSDPSLDHYRELVRRATDLNAVTLGVPEDLAADFFIASSDPVATQALLDGDLGELLADLDWCIVQVLDGYAVFIGSRRVVAGMSTPPRDEGELEQNLDDATRCFDALLAGQGAPPRAAEPAPARPEAAAPRPARSAALGTGLGVRVARVLSGGVGAVFAILGLASVLFTWPQWQGERASVSWPTAPGTVTSANFVEHQRGDSARWEPEFVYAYTVNGAEYTGTRLQYGVLNLRKPESVDAFRSAFPVGAQVQVAYDPSDPQDCALLAGPHAESVTGTGLCCSGGFGFGALAGVAGALLLGRRRQG